jgi:hypothetical protein
MTLLAAYSFDEASGAALDASGNGRDVTLAAPLTRVTGHTNTGLGVSSGTVADSSGPSLTGLQTAAYTVMCWVRRTSNAQDGWLQEFKQSGSGDRGVLFTGGNIQSRCKNVAGTVFTVQTTQPTAGTAYHVAATNDGTTLRLYINGSQVGTGTAFSGGVRTNSTSSHFLDGVGTESWIDDARYYDTALDAATITTLMNTPVSAGATMSLARATETDTARTAALAKSLQLAAAGESDAARTVTLAKALQHGTAGETDTARALTLAKALSAAGPTESDQARAFTTTKSPALAIATEASVARVMAFAKVLPLDHAAETDTARAVLLGGSGLVLGVAAELDVARAASWTKLLPLGRALEVDAAQAWSAGPVIPYIPVTDPASKVRANLATATARANAATATIRANTAEAAQ